MAKFDKKTIRKTWTDKVSKALVGKKITKVEYLSDKEVKDSGWYKTPVAIQLDNASVEPFIENTDKETALIIYCYHGISSNSAASFFVEQGFSRVHHIVGGFEAWQCDELPIQTT